MTAAPVMSITDELVTELELLSRKATRGPWWIDSHGHTMMATDTLDVVFSMPSTKGAVRHPETGNLSCWRNDWDASYIAAANPATILALLAERAELKRDAERYRWLRDSEELESDQFCAINEWIWGDGDFTYVVRAIDDAIDAAMQAAQ